VLLAALDDDEIMRRLNATQILQLTPKTIISKEDILNQIGKARETGYAVSEQELSMDLCSIAVPLINGQKKTAAAVNVSLDAMRMNQVGVLEGARRRLFEKGEFISRLLGYQGPYPKIFLH
jgi:IclR family pca regulon transcriptional regulator